MKPVGFDRPDHVSICNPKEASIGSSSVVPEMLTAGKEMEQLQDFAGEETAEQRLKEIVEQARTAKNDIQFNSILRTSAKELVSQRQLEMATDLANMAKGCITQGIILEMIADHYISQGDLIRATRVGRLANGSVYEKSILKKVAQEYKSRGEFGIAKQVAMFVSDPICRKGILDSIPENMEENASEIDFGKESQGARCKRLMNLDKGWLELQKAELGLEKITDIAKHVLQSAADSGYRLSPNQKAVSLIAAFEQGNMEMARFWLEWESDDDSHCCALSFAHNKLPIMQFILDSTQLATYRQGQAPKKRENFWLNSAFKEALDEAEDTGNFQTALLILLTGRITNFESYCWKDVLSFHEDGENKQSNVLRSSRALTFLATHKSLFIPFVIEESA